MTFPVGMSGDVPVLAQGQANREAEKYGRMWALPEYRVKSPGEDLAQDFLDVARPKPGSTVVDLGAGTGRGALMLAVLGRVKVVMVDFVRNCLDDDLAAACQSQPDTFRFIKADLEQPLPKEAHAQYGFCCDVLEHIPTDRVGRVIDNVLRAAQHVFFSVSTVPDLCGDLIGELLHLTVKPFDWWLEQFRSRDCVIHWSRVSDQSFAIFVTAWVDGQAVVDVGVLNEAEQQVRANVAANLAAGWTAVESKLPNNVEVLILGGGPSLAHFEEDIRARKADGAKIVALNGAGPWALERGLGPVNICLVDARPFNARFTHPPDARNQYFLASQCHPSVFEGLPRDRVFMYHTMPNLCGDLCDAHYGVGKWLITPGGSTVLLRAIPLLRQLGFQKFHLYGCDSCLAHEGVESNGRTHYQHHAYAQAENDLAENQVLSVTTNPGGRVFHCYPWMVSQAQEFLSLIKAFGNLLELEVYGDGLLAYIMRTGASLDGDVLA